MSKINFMDFQCAIFDLDGTLINSTGVWNKVDEDFFNRRNVIMPPEFPQVIKTHTLMSGAVYIKDRLSLPESPEDIVKEWHDAAVYAYHNDVRIKPYVKELLKLLKNSYGYKIGLATSNTHELYDQCLINNGIYDYFDSFTQSDEVERLKGFPDIYEKSAERMGVPKEECIVFEDVYQAVKGARMGNFFTVAVEDSASADDREEIIKIADVYIKSFRELV
ncbi:MAG: HAD family phosphatase [Lachnospira sp.]|nr:HAD family phosphatase [Lachnospira sp.]